MAEKLYIEIGAKIDQAVAELDKLSKRIDNFNESTADIAKTAGVAFAAISGFIGVAVHAYGEQERAINKLNNVLQNQGIYTDALSESYVKLSGKMQEHSNFADEQILSAMATAQGYLGEIEVTEDLTRAILDLAQAKGMDLNSAAQMIGKTIATDTNALTRMGIEVDTTADKQEKLGQVIAGVNKIMGGQAEAASKDVLGALNQAKMAIGDVMEIVGEQFAPIISKAALEIRDLAKALQENKDALKIGVFIIEVTAALAGMTLIVLGAVKAFGLLAAAIVAVHAAINPIGAILIAVGVAVTALSVAWVQDFYNIQEVIMGVIAYIKSLASSVWDILTMSGKAGDEGVLKKAGDAYDKAYDDRLKTSKEVTAQITAQELQEAEKNEKSKYKLFTKRLGEEAKAQKEADLKAAENFQKIQTEIEGAKWEAIIKDNEAAAKATQNLEAQKFQYAYDRILNESLAEAESQSEIEDIYNDASEALEDIHQRKLERIAEEKGDTLEAQALIAQSEFDYYKTKEDLARKITKAKEGADEAFYKKINDAIRTIKHYMEGIAEAFMAGRNFLAGGFLNDIGSAIGNVASIPLDLSKNAEDFMALISSLPEKIEASVADMPEMFNRLIDASSKFISQIIKSIIETIPVILKGLKEFIPVLLKSILDVMPQLITVLMASIPDIADILTNAFLIFLDQLPFILDSFLASLPEIIENFFKNLSIVVEAMVNSIPYIVTVFANNILPIVAAVIKGLIEASPKLLLAWAEVSVAWAAIGGAIGWAMAALAPVWVLIAGYISSGIASLTPVWMALGVLIGTAIDAGVIAGVAIIAAAIITWLVIELYKNWDKVKNFFSAIFETLAEIFRGIYEAFSMIFGGLVDALRSLFSWLEGIVNGIADIGGKVAGKNSILGKIGSGIGSIFKADGGIVPRYAATGMFVPRGTDTVPAMLTPGEFVVNKEATSKNLGLLQSINAGGSAAQEIVLRIIGDDDFGKLVEKSLIKMSTLGTSRLRVAVGSEA